MATTFNYYIRPGKRGDNTMAVTIRITHNRKNKYLPTSIYVDKTQVSKDCKVIRDLEILEIIDSRIKDLRKALLKVKFPDMLSVDDLTSLLLNIIRGDDAEVFKLDLFDYAAILCDRMEVKTADGYRTALNAVKRFIKKDRLDINDITTSWVMRFRDFLETEPPVVGKNGTTYRQKHRGSRAISYYLGCIRHIHNEARMEYNDEETGVIRIPRQPFAHKDIVPPMPLTEHRTISVEEIRRIVDIAPAPGSRAELARDVFMLSFSLAGTNTIDIYNAMVTDLHGDLLTYCRAKTDSITLNHSKITLKMLPIALELLDKYRGKHGSLFSFSSRYSNSHEFNRAVNIGLKKVAEMAGIEAGLSSYYVRHSWATIARNVVGIDKDTVNSALDHSSKGADRIVDIYIAKDYTAIWRAQEAVMSTIMDKKETAIIRAII